MCNASCIIFGATNLTIDQVKGKRVLEVGSYDLNGSLRPIIESWKPAEYVGIDIKEGPGVDLVCDVDDIVDRFGKESFDIVISTELLEHVRDWKKVISNIKKVCRQNGIILLTTRSFGFPYHAYPDDFWRFELADLADIFSDCTIEKLEKDRIGPGVFIKARKPNDFVEKNFSDYELYSIIVDKRVKEIDQASFTRFQEKYRRRLIRRRLERSIKQFVSKITAVRSRRSGSPMTN